MPSITAAVFHIGGSDWRGTDHINMLGTPTARAILDWAERHADLDDTDVWIGVIPDADLAGAVPGSPVAVSAFNATAEDLTAIRADIAERAGL